MTQDVIEVVIVSQNALIVALDTGDVGAIEEATQALSNAIQHARSGSSIDASKGSDRISYALKQTEAARIRVNYLADRNRQKIDDLARRRGVGRTLTYAASGKFVVRAA